MNESKTQDTVNLGDLYVPGDLVKVAIDTGNPEVPLERKGVVIDCYRLSSLYIGPNLIGFTQERFKAWLIAHGLEKVTLQQLRHKEVWVVHWLALVDDIDKDNMPRMQWTPSNHLVRLSLLTVIDSAEKRKRRLGLMLQQQPRQKDLITMAIKGGIQ